MEIIYYSTMGMISIFSIYWQSRKISLEEDYYKLMSITDYENPSNLTYPFYFSLTIIGSIFIYGAYSLLNGGSELLENIYDFFTLLAKGLVFMIVVILKSYCGPIVLGYVFTTFIYNLMNTGEMELLPVFVITLKWVFSSVSQPFHILYTILISLFAFNSTIELMKN